MADKAIVKKILPENRAVVLKLPEERPHKECSGCGGCGASNQKIETIALNLLDAKPGDTVSIESDERKSLFLLFVLIGTPILTPLAFYLIGSSLGLPGLVSGGMAAFGLYAAYRIIKFYNKKVESETPLTKIVEVQRNVAYDKIGRNDKQDQIERNEEHDEIERNEEYDEIERNEEYDEIERNEEHDEIERNEEYDEITGDRSNP